MRFLPIALTGLLLGSASMFTACVGDDPDAANGSDAGSAADGSTSNEGSTKESSDGSPGPDDDAGITDAGVTDTEAAADAKPLPFCQTAAASGAAFCQDFENATDVADGWDTTAVNGGATATLNKAFGFQSSRSATMKLGGSNGAQATLSKLVSAGSIKTKVSIQYDAYFVFPSWSASSINGFVTGLTRTSTVGLSSQYFFDLERQPADWKITAQSGNPASLSTGITPDVWHHIDMTFDTSGPSAAIRVTVDNTLVGTLSLVKGSPGAPASFDQVTVNAGIENYGQPVTTTEFTVDNIVVRFF